jgi:hypothetical protein
MLATGNRFIFIELPEETPAPQGDCFLRSLGTQQEDESQNNVSRKKLYNTSATTGRGFGLLLHITS